MAQSIDLDFLRRHVNYEYGPEVAALFKEKDLLEFGHNGMEAPLRMRNVILKIGAKR